MKIRKTITQKEMDMLCEVLDWYDNNKGTLVEAGVDIDQDLYYIIEETIEIFDVEEEDEVVLPSVAPNPLSNAAEKFERMMREKSKCEHYMSIGPTEDICWCGNGEYGCPVFASCGRNPAFCKERFATYAAFYKGEGSDD